MGERGQFGVGERAADFVLPGAAGVPARFYARAGGRPTALVFDRRGEDPRLADLASRLAGREDVAVCCVTVGQPTVGTGIPVWSDQQGKVAAAYGVPAAELTAVVLDPNLRVVGVVTGERFADRVLALLDSVVHRGPAAQVVAQAPVLLLPRALDEAYRDRLIRLWETAGAVDIGVARSSGDGLDASYKRRRDHIVADPELLRELSSVVGRRVLPEVQKAFAFRATRFEGFKIACYDAATGGFFRPHRDNLMPSTGAPGVRAHPESQRRLRRRTTAFSGVWQPAVSARARRGAGLLLRAPARSTGRDRRPALRAAVLPLRRTRRMRFAHPPALQGVHSAQEPAHVQEVCQRLAVLLTRQPGLLPSRQVDLRVVPDHGVLRRRAAALRRADHRRAHRGDHHCAASRILRPALAW
jgi:hypothetical protein